MASWTDAITQFNPYVPTLPVDAMVKVGMQKQAMYEQGVQKIQSQIDQVAGLDILRDVDTNYLQTKLNELGSNLTSVAGADFSNFQLVNSVAGMTKQIAKDIYIQAAVSSTANHRKQLSDMEAEKKKGTLTPENEKNYQKQLSKYLQSGLKDESGAPIVFSGKYTPYFDVFKYAKETFDAVKPDGMSWDEIYQMGADGKPLKDARGNLILSETMTRMEKEGIFPQKVKQTLNQIFSDPRVSQQLQITGEYNYANYDERALYDKILAQKTDALQNYQAELYKLNIQKNLGKNVQKDIDDLISTMTKIDDAYNKYAEAASTNPDAVRGMLYKDDVTSRYTTMFSWEKSKQQVMENPAWRAKFEIQKEANANSRWAQQFEYTKQRDVIEDQKWQAKYDQDERHFIIEQTNKAAAAKGKNGTAGEGVGPGGLTPTQADEASSLDIQRLYEGDIRSTNDKYLTSTMEYVSEISFGKDVNFQKDLATNLTKYGGDRGEALLQTLNKYIPHKGNFITQDDLLTAAATGEGVQGTIGLTPDWMVKQQDKMHREDPKNFQSGADFVAERKKLGNNITNNPVLMDKFQNYQKAASSLNVMIDKKKQVDDEVKRLTGGVGDIIDKALIDASGKTYSFGESERLDGRIDKDDLRDLALYVMGGDEGDKAYKRLVSRNYKLVADQVYTAYNIALDERTLDRGSPVSPAYLNYLLKDKTIYSDPRPGMSGRHELAKEVLNIVDLMKKNDYSKVFDVKSNAIKNVWYKQPTLKVPLLSGDTETDKSTVYSLRAMAGEYTSGQKQNLSTDFSGFASSISGDIKDFSLQARIVPGPDNSPVVEIVSYDKDGERSAGMTIQTDEAASLGIDVNTLYESQDMRNVRRAIDVRGGKTSYGVVSIPETYTSGDAYFKRYDFPAMKDPNLDISGNIIMSEGMYYPYIYVSDGTKNNVRPLPGSPDLQTAVSKMKNIDATLANLILNQP